MTVTFKKTVHFAFDGVHVRKYEAGKSYTATHAHEKRMFDMYLESGDAVEQASEAEPKTEKKVVRPKERK